MTKRKKRNKNRHLRWIEEDQEDPDGHLSQTIHQEEESSGIRELVKAELRGVSVVAIIGVTKGEIGSGEDLRIEGVDANIRDWVGWLRIHF